MPQGKKPKDNEDLTLDDHRAQIDSLDSEIIRLLNQRATHAQGIGVIKSKADLPKHVPEREHLLLNRLEKMNAGPLHNDSVRTIYKEIISASLALEAPLSVAYLGPQATFTHSAAKRHFGMSARLVHCSTIPQVFQDVERSRHDFGVVPIENSTEGMVHRTLDMLMTSELTICAEVLLQVGHHLLNVTGSLESVEKIYSHKQAIAQCGQWLRDNLPGVPLIDVASTARAAQLASQDPTAAAIASEMAANLYELKVIASHLEDMSDNVTRFLILGRQTTEPTDEDRTSVVFALKDAPGVLAKALHAFSSRDINLSRIESRPSRRRAWDYHFFVDLVGHKKQESVAQAIGELSGVCDMLKVLGSYPRGRVLSEV